MKYLKNHLFSILLTGILLVPYFVLADLLSPFTEAITKGMSSRDSSRVEMFIVCMPIVACYFLIDFIKKRYFDKEE